MIEINATAISAVTGDSQDTVFLRVQH